MSRVATGRVTLPVALWDRFHSTVTDHEESDQA